MQVDLNVKSQYIYIHILYSDIQSDRIGYLLSQDEVDVWAMTGEHADVRLHYSLYQSMRDQLPECTVLHASVEALMQQDDRNMERSNLDKTAGWFEEYVSVNYSL